MKVSFSWNAWMTWNNMCLSFSCHKTGRLVSIQNNLLKANKGVSFIGELCICHSAYDKKKEMSYLKHGLFLQISVTQVGTLNKNLKRKDEMSAEDKYQELDKAELEDAINYMRQSRMKIASTESAYEFFISGNDEYNVRLIIIYIINSLPITCTRCHHKH